jgi:hypothetical protein
MLATTAEHDLAVAVTKHRIGTRVTVRGEAAGCPAGPAAE